MAKKSDNLLMINFRVLPKGAYSHAKTAEDSISSMSGLNGGFSPKTSMVKFEMPSFGKKVSINRLSDDSSRDSMASVEMFKNGKHGHRRRTTVEATLLEIAEEHAKNDNDQYRYRSTSYDSSDLQHINEEDRHMAHHRDNTNASDLTSNNGCIHLHNNGSSNNNEQHSHTMLKSDVSLQSAVSANSNITDQLERIQNIEEAKMKTKKKKHVRHISETLKSVFDEDDEQQEKDMNQLFKQAFAMKINDTPVDQKDEEEDTFLDMLAEQSNGIEYGHRISGVGELSAEEECNACKSRESMFVELFSFNKDDDDTCNNDKCNERGEASVEADGLEQQEVTASSSSTNNHLGVAKIVERDRIMSLLMNN